MFDRAGDVQRDRGEVEAVLIAGPTASGKSALAMALAEAADGVVINTDSMQVYRDLRILTARPTPADEARVPHRLYGTVDAAINCSAGAWVAAAAPVLAEARAAGRLPIFTGGTGLYFKALTRGLSAVPPVPPAVREAVRTRLARDGVAALHAELARRDPVSAAKLKPRDQARIARALEVVEATGRPLPDWAAESDATSSAQIMLKYLVSHPAVTCAVPGMAQARYVDDNIRAAQGRMPDAALRRRMDQYFDAI